MKKEDIYIDLSKLSLDERKDLWKILDESGEKIGTVTTDYRYKEKLFEDLYPFIIFNCGEFQCVPIKWLSEYFENKTEITFTQFKDLFNKKQEQAERYNSGKLKWSLVDFESLEPLVSVLEYGAKKYSPHNWKKGMPITEIEESLFRHLTSFMKGEDRDQESGESHIGHIMANAMFLAYIMKNKPEFDNRNK